MLKNKQIKHHGLFNPLNGGNANFDFEVEEIGEVKNVEYPDGYGGTYTQPELQVLLRKAGGFIVGDEVFCTISGEDALKPLREEELFSAKLRFGVKKDAEGNYQQQVTAENVFTLNDYYQIRQASNLWKAGLRQD